MEWQVAFAPVLILALFLIFANLEEIKDFVVEIILAMKGIKK